MVSLEQLREKLRVAKAKQSLEDHAQARVNEEKSIKKELFLLKHKKKIAAFGRAKKNIVHMSKNAQAMAKKVKSTSNKKKKKRKNNSPFGNFNFV